MGRSGQDAVRERGSMDPSTASFAYPIAPASLSHVVCRDGCCPLRSCTGGRKVVIDEGASS